MKTRNHGFTLVEVIVALAVLAIAILSLFALLTQGIRGNASANRITSEVVLASDLIENIRGRNYFDIDGDGVGDDSGSENVSGDVDGDGVAGLDDSLCCQNGLDPSGAAAPDCGGGGGARADFCAVSADNNFFIYWNVAVDEPENGMKMIRVHVRDRNGNSPDTSVTTMKVDI